MDGLNENKIINVVKKIALYYFQYRAYSFGAKDEIRTRDPDLGKVVLYQLSYFRIVLRGQQK